jgi:hypothetical protein
LGSSKHLRSWLLKAWVPRLSTDRRVRASQPVNIAVEMTARQMTEDQGSPVLILDQRRIISLDLWCNILVLLSLSFFTRLCISHGAFLLLAISCSKWPANYHPHTSMCQCSLLRKHADCICVLISVSWTVMQTGEVYVIHPHWLFLFPSWGWWIL